MKETKAEWFIEYWKELLFAFFFLFIAVPALIYHLATVDPKLKNIDSRNQLKEKLAQEMKQLSLPSKTAVNKFEATSKDFSILVSTRYRTELNQQEFVSYLTQQLKKTGWISYGSSYSINYNFCRDNQYASLNYEGQGGLFGDGGNYYNLDFSVGLVGANDNLRPPNCR